MPNYRKAGKGMLRALEYAHLLNWIIEKFGWWGTLAGWGKTMVAAISAIIVFVWPWLSHLETAKQLVLALATFVAILLVWNTEVKLRGGFRLRWPWEKFGPRLDFAGWHSGSDFGYPRYGTGLPSFVRVTNTDVKVPRIAKNVRTGVEWINDEGTHRLPVPEADWFARDRQEDGGSSEGWRSSVNLDGGDEQSFVLSVADDQKVPWIYKRGAAPVGVLDAGHWYAYMTVASDTAQGFKGKLGFTVSRDGGITPDPHGFTMLRRVPPQLQRAQ